MARLSEYRYHLAALFTVSVWGATFVSTKALIAALPKSGNRERLVAIEGQPPTIVHMPPGCPFSNRCAYATEACRQSVPELKPIDEHHMTACHMNLVTSGGK